MRDGSARRDRHGVRTALEPTLRLARAALLGGYAWPGNVRELRNLMEHAAVLCADAVVGRSLARSLLPAAVEPASADLNLERALADLEQRMIDALAATEDNRPAAARLLGIGERTLWTKLKRYDI